MAFNPNSAQHNDTMAEINVTPMVDVMLVLLIIFMITVPVITQSITVELPSADVEKTQTVKPTMALELKLDGSYWWDEKQVSFDQVTSKFTEISTMESQPVIELYADGDIPYKQVVKVMAAAQRQGVTSLGFVTEVESAAE